MIRQAARRLWRDSLKRPSPLAFRDKPPLTAPPRLMGRSFGWGLLLALFTGLSHAQTGTPLVEGLAAIGGITLNPKPVAAPASPLPATRANLQTCLTELERHRMQLEQAHLPDDPAGKPGGHALAPSAGRRPYSTGPTASQTQTLRTLFDKIHTVCEESALLESSPSLTRFRPHQLGIQAAITAPAPTDRRALYALEVQADQEEQALNGLQTLRESNQQQLQRLQSRLPGDNTTGDAATGTPATQGTSDPWDQLIAEARLSLAVRQLQHLQALDALLARKFSAGTEALTVLQADLRTWRGQIPLSSKELALIRAPILERIHRLENPLSDARAHPTPEPQPRSGPSDHGSMPLGFWSQLLRQAQIDLHQRNLQAWQWRYELLGPQAGDPKTLATQLERQNQDLQALERSLSPLLDGPWTTAPAPAGPSPVAPGTDLQSDLLTTLGLLNETRQNMRILASELQDHLEAQSPVRRGWDQARHEINTWAHEVWDFNLLTLKEKISVNGQDVTTTQNITIGKSIGAVLVLLVGYLVGSWALRQMRMSLARLGARTSTADRIYWMAKLVLVAVLLIFAMNLLNIPMSALSLPGGVLAVGLGFGAQNLLKNLIGALILQLTHPVKLNDYIVLDQHSGFVKSMGWQFCVIRGFDGDETIVPNVDMLSGSLVNWTFKDLQMRRSITVGVAYGSPTQKTMDILAEAARQAPFVLQDPAPVVYFTDFGDSALVFQLKFWVEMGSLNPHVIETAVRLRIDEAMRTANITISFPQRDVHLYQTEPLQVSVRQ